MNSTHVNELCFCCFFALIFVHVFQFSLPLSVPHFMRNIGLQRAHCNFNDMCNLNKAIYLFIQRSNAIFIRRIKKKDCICYIELLIGHHINYFSIQIWWQKWMVIRIKVIKMSPLRLISSKKIKENQHIVIFNINIY